jgi:copper transport protein
MIRTFLAVLMLGWASLAAVPAGAHAVLLSTSPADRTVLDQAPDALALTFNEPVKPISLRLLDDAGQQIAANATVEIHHGEIRMRLPHALADGAYLLSYRVTSEDSHPVGGTLLFAVGAEPSAWRAAPLAEDNPLWIVVNAANRALHLAGSFGLAGGIAFLLLFPGERLADRRALSPLLFGCAALSIVTATLTIGAHGALLADAAPSDIFASKTWRLGLASTRGTASLTALCAAIMLALALRAGVSKRRQAWFSPFAVLGLGLAVLAFLVSGHAATAQPRWLTLPALGLHVAVAGLWLGSLVPLLRGMARFNKGTMPRIAGFSSAMSWAMPALLMGGAVLAAVQLQSWSELATSRYGSILLLKLLMVSALLGFAANNKYRLLPALRQGLDGYDARFAVAIRWEITLGLAILAATALLSQTMPPRSFGAHDGHDHADPLRGYSTVVTTRGRMALINIDPAVVGRNRLDVRFAAGDGQPFSPLEATVVLANEIAGIEGLTRRLDKIGDGHFRLSGPEFALSGTWRLQIDALISDYEKISFIAAIPIAR